MSTTPVKLPEIEHIKSRKNGLDVLADIYRYAELGFDAIEPDDLALFRWYGVYTQRAEESAASNDPGPSEDTDGNFMLRVKFPGGRVSSDQLRTIGKLSERYGRSMGDITTRQNIQLHWLPIEDIPVVLDELNAAGLSFTQACGDVWRNIVGCPLAGVDGHELLDSRPVIDDLERTFVGDRRFSNLPRKFKVSVSGCLHGCAQHEINDLALVAVDKDGEIGYDVWVGGGLGASAHIGRRLDVFVKPEDAAEICAVITEIYRDEGKRTKRTRARIKFLVDEWGPERLRDEVEAKIGHPLSRSVEPPAPIDPHRDHLGVHPQGQPGLYYIGATTLRGRFTADQMIGVADIADRFGSGEIRCTNRQNLIVLDVPDAQVEEAAASLADLGLPTEASTFRRGIISCTGMQFCKLAIVETKDRAAELIDHLRAPRGRRGGFASHQPERVPQRVRPVPDRGHRAAGRHREARGRHQNAGLHPAHRRPPRARRRLRPQGLEQGDAGRRHEVRRRADRAGLCGRARGGRHLLGLVTAADRRAAGRACRRAGRP